MAYGMEPMDKAGSDMDDDGRDHVCYDGCDCPATRKLEEAQELREQFPFGKVLSYRNPLGDRIIGQVCGEVDPETRRVYIATAAGCFWIPLSWIWGCHYTAHDVNGAVERDRALHTGESAW